MFSQVRRIALGLGVARWCGHLVLKFWIFNYRLFGSRARRGGIICGEDLTFRRFLSTETFWSSRTLDFSLFVMPTFLSGQVHFLTPNRSRINRLWSTWGLTSSRCDSISFRTFVLLILKAFEKTLFETWSWIRGFQYTRVYRTIISSAWLKCFSESSISQINCCRVPWNPHGRFPLNNYLFDLMRSWTFQLAWMT